LFGDPFGNFFGRPASEAVSEVFLETHFRIFKNKVNINIWQTIFTKLNSLNFKFETAKHFRDYSKKREGR
jgi:hypothetical protein